MRISRRGEKFNFPFLPARGVLYNKKLTVGVGKLNLLQMPRSINCMQPAPLNSLASQTRKSHYRKPFMPLLPDCSFLCVLWFKVYVNSDKGLYLFAPVSSVKSFTLSVFLLPIYRKKAGDYVRNPGRCCVLSALPVLSHGGYLALLVLIIDYRMNGLFCCSDLSLGVVENFSKRHWARLTPQKAWICQPWKELPDQWVFFCTFGVLKERCELVFLY